MESCNVNLKSYLATCYNLASYSPDPSNQNGAILINDNGEILVAGFNHIPAKSGEELLKILANRDEKMQHICHAEEIVIDLAAEAGIRTRGLTMICPWASCMSCARSIIVSGIDRLIVHQERMDTTPDRWRPSVEMALAWLKQAKVRIDWYSGSIAEAPKILANGVMWQP